MPRAIAAKGEGGGGGIGCTLEDPEEQILATVIWRPLTTVKMNVRRLRCKNVNVLWLSFKQPEREAMAETVTKAKAAQLAKAQDHIAQRMSGNIYSSDDSDLTDGSSSSFDDDAPPSFDAYMEVHSRTGDPKGKGPARKWLFPSFLIYLGY
jgi:hypothetical protein